jgi:hypothetical protein
MPNDSETVIQRLVREQNEYDAAHPEEVAQAEYDALPSYYKRHIRAEEMAEIAADKVGH